MKNGLIYCTLLLVSHNAAFSQVFDWALTIEKISGFDSEVNAIAVDGDNNVFITGYIWSTLDFDASSGTAYVSQQGVDWYDVYLAKYDSAGNYQWAFAMGAGSTDEGYALVTDQDGNVYMSGSYAGKVDFDPSPDTAFLENYGGFLTKYDPYGNLLWVIATGGWGLDMHYDNTGNILMTGNYNNSDFDPTTDTLLLNSTGMFIAKYDTVGNFLWVKGLSTSTDASVSYALDVDGDGNIIIAGTLIDSVDFDPSADTVFIAEISDSRKYAFFAKYDNFGNYLWVKSTGSDKIGFGPSLYCYAYDVCTDNANNVYITGQFRDTVDFDPSGNVAILEGAVFGNIYVAKYNSTGEYIWANSIGTINGWYGGHVGSTVNINSNGNLFVTGKFNDSVIIDTSTLMANGNGILLAKYTAGGSMLWAFSIDSQGGASSAFGLALAMDNGGNPIISSSFGNVVTSDFDPGVNTAWFSGELFIAKYKDTLTYISVAPLDNYDKSIIMYPNPTTGVFVLEHPANAKIVVINSLGQKIYESISTGKLTHISLGVQPKGLYYVRIHTEEEAYYGKLIVH